MRNRPLQFSPYAELRPKSFSMFGLEFWDFPREGDQLDPVGHLAQDHWVEWMWCPLAFGLTAQFPQRRLPMSSRDFEVSIPRMFWWVASGG